MYVGWFCELIFDCISPTDSVSLLGKGFVTNSHSPYDHHYSNGLHLTKNQFQSTIKKKETGKRKISLSCPRNTSTLWSSPVWPISSFRQLLDVERFPCLQGQRPFIRSILLVEPVVFDHDVYFFTRGHNEGFTESIGKSKCLEFKILPKVTYIRKVTFVLRQYRY